MRLPLLLALAAAVAWPASPFRVYVADLEPTAVTLAWGRADGAGENTIGKNAAPGGAAVIELGGRRWTTDRPWLRLDQLQPDTSYTYRVTWNGESREAQVRTWPAKATSLVFLAVGDFGNGSKEQYSIARRMEEERRRLESEGKHVRFVLALGDIIYGNGSQDRDWESKFFQPYADTLAAIPFKAIPGNHDGNQSEKAADLPALLDNLFFPERWYRVEYGGFFELLALDTTTNQADGKPAPVFLASGDQTQWFSRQLARRPLPWRVVAMHNPMFTAGPNHRPFLAASNHWFLAMRSAGVQTVFSGHEHNLQYSFRNPETGGMQFIVSGAGGERRSSSVRKRMNDRQIAAWSNQHHFLVVSVDEQEMIIDPVGYEPIRLRDASGRDVSPRLSVASKR